MKNEVIKHEIRDLANPAQIMEVGTLLATFIKNNNLSVKIQGKDYPMVDGWKFAGANFGIVAMAKEPVRVSEKDEMVHTLHAVQQSSRNGRTFEREVVVYASTSIWSSAMFKDIKERNPRLRESHKPYFAFDCAADLMNINTQMIIGGGHATCTNLEAAKNGFDEYAVKSMAQTRAIGKAYRNLLGYIMNSAGLESTSAEEMYERQVSEEAVKNVKKPQLTDAKLKEALPLLKNKKLTVERIVDAFAVTDGQLMMLQAAAK